METHRIYRNLQTVPKIWGITFPKLFGVLFGGLIVMMPLMFTLPRLLAFGVTAALMVTGLVVCWIMDQQDPVTVRARRSRFIKQRLTAYARSSQTVRIEG